MNVQLSLPISYPTAGTIHHVTASIIMDSSDEGTNIEAGGRCVFDNDTNTITLYNNTGGIFNNVNYQGSGNRGYVIIHGVNL